MTKPSTKKLLCFLYIVFFAALISNVTVNAQSYILTSSSQTFTPISGTQVGEIEGDVGISDPIDIGFTFNFLGTSYTQLKASANGFLTFNLAALDNPNNVISTSANLIAPLWDDLNGGTGDGPASYVVTGSSPNRVFTFEWLNWSWRSTAPVNISFQVKLYETTNVIEFTYRRELGALTNAENASIGLVGDTSAKFYSLLNSGASPTLDLYGNGIDNINIKPLTNQVYTFTPTAAAEPITPASNISAIETSTDLNLSWTNGNGSYRAVFVKQTSAVETVPVVDGKKYTPNTIFGSGTSENGWYCVYNGTGSSSVFVTGLQSGLTYRTQVVEYNGIATAQNYVTTAATNNPKNFATLVTTPTLPVSTLTLWRASDTEIEVDLIEGNGTNRAIFVKEGTLGTASVVNGTTYNASTVFKSGDQVATSGWYCVFNGPSSTGFTITGLTPNKDYRIHAIDYNGSAGSEQYNIQSVTNNPVQLVTLPAFTIPTYNFSAASGAFTPISSATAVDAIEVNDALSSSITLPFTFKLGGTSYTQFKASSNGFLTFNTFASNVGTDATNALSTSALRSLVAPLWDDLSGVGGQASYTTTGTTPDRVFIFEWLNWKWNPTASANISFQVKLYETSNKIEYVYRQDAGAVVSPNGASIGMAFPNKGDGKFISLNGSGTSPSATTSTLSETSNIIVRPATGQIYTFNISGVLLNQTITFNALPAKVYNDANFDLMATASSGLTVTYVSSNPAIASISGNTVTILAAGSTTIKAMQAGNATYDAAPDVNQLLVVGKANQTITFGALAAKNFGDASFNLGATASSTLPVSYISSNTAVAIISDGNKVNIVGVGETIITASQAGNGNYNAAANAPQSFVVGKANQTITYTLVTPKLFGTPNFDLTQNASSGLAINYTSSNTSVATISGNTVTIVGIGSTEITGSQAGNVNYNAAAIVKKTLVVNKGNQTITFNALPSKATTDMPFTLGAEASSGLPITYTSSNTAVATISGNTVTIVGVAGSTNITASQPGNANYNAASGVIQPLEIKVKTNQTITFDEVSVKTIGAVPFLLTVSASSGLPVQLTSASIPGKITISGKQVTLVSAGSVTITAEQAGNDNFKAAPSISRTFCINPAKPTILSVSADAQPILTSSSASGNQWFLNDVAINGATGGTYRATQSGIFTVKVNVDNCSSEASENKTLIVTGIETYDFGIKVFPNPVENTLIVDVSSLPSTNPTIISVFDALGKTLQTLSGKGVIHVELGAYKAGNYLIHITNGTKVFSKHITRK